MGVGGPRLPHPAPAPRVHSADLWEAQHGPQGLRLAGLVLRPLAGAAPL